MKTELLSKITTFTLMFMHVVGFTLLKANLMLSTNGWQPETLALF